MGADLAETAETGLLHHHAELFQQRQIIGCGLPLGDLVEQAVNMDGADAAGDAFAAGFVLAEIHEVLCHIHHVWMSNP